MTEVKIKKGTIKCKFCNKDYPDMLSSYNCSCGKGKKWNPPHYKRRLDRKRGGYKTHKNVSKNS